MIRTGRSATVARWTTFAMMLGIAAAADARTAAQAAGGNARAAGATTTYRALGRFEPRAAGVARDADLDAPYRAAVRDASFAEPHEIRRDLVSLTTDTADLLWFGDGAEARVLLVTWTGWDGYVGREGDEMELGVDVWTTPYPLLRDFTSGAGDVSSATLNLRLEQWLGLPPDGGKQYVVELRARPDDVFRPAPDPEVTDREAELDFPRSSRYLSVADSHRTWIENLREVSYGEDGYPWTRLGYTYDWAAPGGVGPSEFVIRQGATVIVHRVRTTEDYAGQTSRRVLRIATELADYAAACRSDWQIPGMALAVVHDDEVALTRLLGTRDAAGSEPLDADTLFQVGSTSKAFTSALVATGVDDGLFDWDDPMIGLDARFDLRDPMAAGMFALRDLMAQHSGLPPYCVTMMGYFGYDPSDIVRAIGYVEPAGAFRRDYAYQNGLYIYAGDLVERATGSDWGAALRERLFEPLGMTRVATDMDAYYDDANHARTYRYRNGSMIQGIREISPETSTVYNVVDAFAPAGAVCAGVEAMTRWVRMQLAGGRFGEVEVVSAENLAATRAPLTIVTAAPGETQAFYGMGWISELRDGRQRVWHNGDTGASHCIVALYPDCDVGLVVLTNLGANRLPEALSLRCFDLLHDRPPTDWSALYLAEDMNEAAEPDPTPPPAPAPPRPFDAYAGPYTNDPMGVVRVETDGESLWMVVGPPGHVVGLEPWNGDRFRARLPWTDEWSDWVTFQVGEDGRATGLVFDAVNRGAVGVFRRLEATAGAVYWMTQ